MFQEALDRLATELQALRRTEIDRLAGESGVARSTLYRVRSRSTTNGVSIETAERIRRALDRRQGISGNGAPPHA